MNNTVNLPILFDKQVSYPPPPPPTMGEWIDNLGNMITDDNGNFIVFNKG